MRAIYSFLILICFLQIGFAAEYQVDKSQKNLVKFISDAPMEDFEGVTDKIDGYLFFEGDNLLQGSEMYFEVDLNSLDTGIGLRLQKARHLHQVIPVERHRDHRGGW